MDTLSHYKILDRLGAGALGEVFRARDTRLGRTVAVRVVPASIAGDPATRERFRREAQQATTLSHPNIATLYEVGEDQGQLSLAGEFVPGESLRAAAAGHPMNPRRAIDLAAQLADALADGHAAGIVHGSVNADRIVITPKGAAKLLDFGLADWVDGRPDATAKAPAADIAAIGEVLAGMVGGGAAGAGRPQGDRRTGVSELDAIIAKARASDGERGYQSAATLAAELRSLGAVLDVRAEAATPAGAVALRPRRPRTGLWILLVLAVLGFGGWLAREPLERTWHRAFGPPPAPVVAVLPLTLETADQGERFFADGIADDLARRLSRVPGLTVPGRSRLRQDRGRDPAELARELGAAVVLTGRVRPQSSPLVVALELVNPANGDVLWSEAYSREPSAIFALEAEVADRVAEALQLDVPPTAARARAAARSVDPAAYRAYLLGRAAAADGRTADAIESFQAAVDADAGMAEALAALALALDAQDGAGPTDTGRRDAAAARAYQLDPDLPEANAAMALGAPDLARALAYLRHGIEVDRSWGDGYRRIADRIRDADPARAADFYRASLAVDPRLEASRAGLALALEMPASAGAIEARDQITTALDGLVK